MVTNYKLKRSPVEPNRIRKTVKQLMQDSADDRKLALETYNKFKRDADDEALDMQLRTNAQKLMVESLKLAQSSKVSVARLMDLLVKYEIHNAAVKDTNSPEKKDETVDFFEED
jgi:hypothetical protein